jgi:hypothetical protein
LAGAATALVWGLVLVYLAVKLNQRLVYWPVSLLVSSYVADVTALLISSHGATAPMVDFEDFCAT